MVNDVDALLAEPPSLASSELVASVTRESVHCLHRHELEDSLEEVGEAVANTNDAGHPRALRLEIF